MKKWKFFHLGDVLETDRKRSNPIKRQLILEYPADCPLDHQFAGLDF